METNKLSMYMPKSAQPVTSTQPKQGYMPKSAMLVPQEKKTLGGFAGNVVKSGANMAKDIGGALVNVFNPDPEKNTVLNTVNLIDSARSFVLPGEQGNEEMAKNVVGFYKDRYGGVDNIGETIYNDPVGVAGDLSTILSGGGTLATKLGTANKISGLARAGSTMSKVGRIADPLTVANRVVSSPASKLFSKSGSKLAETGEKLASRGLGSTKKLDDLARRAGTTREALIAKYNLYDRDPTSALEAARSAVNKADELTLGSNRQLPVSDFVEAIDQEITRLSDIPIEAMDDSTLSQIKELQRQKKAIVAMSGGQDVLSPEKTLRYRREIKVPKSEFGLDAKGTGSAAAKKSTRDIFRRKINELDPNIAQNNLDYGALKEMQQAFSRYQSRSGGKRALNFGKLMSGGIGSVIGGAPGFIGGLVLDELSDNANVLKYGSKGMMKAGQIIEDGVVIPQGVKRAGRAAYDVGRGARLLTPTTSTTESQQIEPTPNAPVITNTPTGQAVSTSSYNSTLPPADVKRKSIIKGSNPFTKTPIIKRGSFN